MFSIKLKFTLFLQLKIILCCHYSFPLGRTLSHEHLISGGTNQCIWSFYTVNGFFFFFQLFSTANFKAVIKSISQIQSLAAGTTLKFRTITRLLLYSVLDQYSEDIFFVKKYFMNVVSMYITRCHFIRFVAGAELKCLVD